MKQEKILKFKISDVPRQTGEVGRIRVLKGAETHATFVLKSNSITLGRGDEVDIIISDIKASRSHARIDYTKDGWIVSDLGSANGIFFQGEYIRKFGLKSGDHFTIGETILEFLGSHEETKMLSSLPKNAEEVQQLDVAMTQQKVRVQNLAKAPKIAANPNAKKSSPLTLLLLAAGAGIYFYMDQTPTAKPQSSAKAAKKDGDAAANDRSLASYLPVGVSKDVEKTADQYYWQGFREYMKGNYLRAKDSFDLALQVNPAHEKARHYLASANKENEDEIKQLISAAKKAKLIGRLQDAKGNCETALRHLYNDRANPDYADCDEIIKQLKGGSEQ